MCSSVFELIYCGRLADMLNLTHIPPRAHTYLASLSLLLGGLMPVVFLSHLPGTLGLWTVEKRCAQICSKVAKILQHKLNQTSELIFHIASIGSKPLWGQREDSAFRSLDGWKHGLRNGNTSHILSSIKCYNVTLPSISPVCSSLPHKHAVGGPQGEGRGGGSCIPTLRTCWNLPPLTKKWSERLTKSNTPWWGEGTALFYPPGTKQLK